MIQEADVFVFIDDVQFTYRDWRNRNRIKTANGLKWLTIPAGSNTKRLIYEVEVPDSSWKAKHKRIITQYYRKAPFFDEYAFVLDKIYDNKITNLSLFNQQATHTLSSLLGLSTPFLDSRTLKPEGTKDDRIIDIVKKVGGTRYLSGPSAKDYISPGKFEAAGIELDYKSYDYPEYPQLYPPFHSKVSILDLLLMVGPKAPKYIWENAP